MKYSFFFGSKHSSSETVDSLDSLDSFIYSEFSEDISYSEKDFSLFILICLSISTKTYDGLASGVWVGGSASYFTGIFLGGISDSVVIRISSVIFLGFYYIFANFC